LSHSERIEQLLSGYPDQLSDGELAELRLAAEQDPEVESLMEAIHEVEFLLSADEEELVELAEGRLSEAGEERLGEAMANARSLAFGVVADSAALRASGPRVVQQRAGNDGSPWVGWMALAAGLLLALGAVVISRLPAPAPGVQPELVPAGSPDFGMKGRPALLSGKLMVRGTGAAPWASGEPRRLDQPVRFYAIVTQPTHLAILEVQAGNTVVLHPSSGQQWTVDSGTHPLQPAGSSAEYRAGRAGPAHYVLVGSAAELQVPAGGVVTSVETLLGGHPGARELGRVEIKWLAVN